MSDDIAIKVEHVSKSFKLPHNKQTSFKGALINLIGNGDRTYETQEVLKDISFEIKKGEFFGIVGRNGSGKSTLLKMLAGIYTPTQGSITVNGSLTPFIELGVGFNPELTGRENVYLNGALLGFSNAEVNSMYDDIVTFAELGRFMDQKLKNYSSGMQVRLAFSIAIRARSDILLLDEVLAVGDEAFQRKCYAYFDTLKRQKKTVVLVTHDMAAIERFCTRALLLEGGKVKIDGKPYRTAAAYSRSNESDFNSLPNIGSGSAPFSVELRGGANKELRKFFNYSDTMTVRLGWTQPNVKGVGVAIFRDNGEYVFGPNTLQENQPLLRDSSIDYSVTLNLNDGGYFVKAGLMGRTDNDVIAFIEEGPHFIVKRDYQIGRWGGVTRLPHSWE